MGTGFSTQKKTWTKVIVGERIVCHLSPPLFLSLSLSPSVNTAELISYIYNESNK
jgi:hypothetical protein